MDEMTQHLQTGYVLAGMFIGFAMGATGVGGGSLMTPLLILWYGVTPKLAVGTDLLVAAITKIVGAGIMNKKQSVDWGIVSCLLLGSLPAAGIIICLMQDMNASDEVQDATRVVLGFTLILTSLVNIIFAINPGLSGMFHTAPRKVTMALTVMAGLLIGGLVTLTSVGAGVIGMMFLILLYPDKPLPVLVGTDMAHAVFITLMAAVGHARLGSVDFMLALSLLIGSLPGVYMGTKMTFLSNNTYCRFFLSLLIALSGSALLLNAWH